MKQILLIICGLIVFLLPLSAFAQTEEEQLSLRLSRDFGYSSGLGDMQGTFSLRASGPENLVRVVFFIDNQVMGEATESPFRLRFNTDDFPVGQHRMTALGYTSDGQELRSNEVQGNFVTSRQGFQQTLKFIIPLLGFIVIALLISLLITMLISRGKTITLPPGSARNYRPFGGTICPKCQRPFGMHLYGLNLMIGKFDRCPYCGKWSLVRAANSAQLAAAEAAELEAATQAAQTSPVKEAEQLERDLADSRFQDL
jgi:hypothetical protein